ncbi:putative rhamnosyl transferase [Epibacterium ulvae]|uniref:glycosyltransferase n=1 Tax=Epibacterium ulvae TaxID=1156985 RepID=UPI001BFC7F95|nr:glycosyltransferase [Epibacterium ulvae]MBT8155777.1 putative rhamnosyl transferase [Epibacterium ulvae]
MSGLNSQTKVQALGLCRWSYPSDSKGFKRGSDTLEDLRARLYTPERLEHRLFLLRHLVLPAIARQTDADFKLIFLMGDQLPAPWRGRILRQLAKIPQIVAVFAKEGQSQYELARAVMSKYRDPAADVIAQFRLDDDDAVATDFVEKSRSVFDDIAPLYNSAGLFGLDFCRGMVMRSSREGCEFTPITMRFWAPGTVIFTAPDNPRSVIDFHHLRLWHEMPTLMWRDGPMFIRGAHHDNDSDIANLGRRARSFQLDAPMDQVLRERFALRPSRLRAAWAANIETYLPDGTGEPLRIADEEREMSSINGDGG